VLAPKETEITETATTRKVVDMERRTALMVCVVLGVLLLAEAALAAPVSPTTVTRGESSRRDLTNLPAQQVAAQAGNVTEINLTAIAVTQSWQGYYGNVSGTIVLQNADNQTFYNWSMATAKGEIYATRTSSVSFTTVDCLLAANITDEETALGQATIDADSVTNTFTTNVHPQFYVGTVDITADTCNATNAFGPSGAQANDFFQILLADNAGAGNIIYTTLLNGTKSSFDNSAWDFELLVGQNGHPGGSTTTQYYLYVELM